MDILSYEFFQRALFAALLASISCGIIGTYVVSKRIVFISDGITHASFGGIGLGYFLGLNPIITATIFGVLSSFGIKFLSSRGKIREDSSIGIFLALGMAIGIIFIYLTPGYAPDLSS
ncbi:MAG: metal ABC transporter permease, partial [Candidatus Delongbacteria bacterium]|nr:metal ABC transporter permease [Candidatus Delongbacteria bacterium]